MLRRLLSQKWVFILFSLITIGGMFLLAASLHDLHFEPGRSLRRSEPQPALAFFDRAVHEVIEIPFWKQVAFWLLFFLLILLASVLLSPEGRKRLLRLFITFALSFLVLSYLQQNNLITLPNIRIGAGEEAKPDVLNEPPPLPVFVPPDLPDWLNYIISLGVMIAFFILFWYLRRWWMRLNSLRGSPNTLKDIASIARSSLRDLSRGADWADAITNCYVRMNEVVSRSHGLSRKAAMTPAEFAHRLERAGLPSEPVRRLTRLFETVRYGSHKPTRDQINEAVSCLNTILRYCGEEI